MQIVLTRNNSITRMSYKDNPIIFAWEVMNEPRFLTDLLGIYLFNSLSPSYMNILFIVRLRVPYHVFSLVKRFINLQLPKIFYFFLIRVVPSPY